MSRPENSEKAQTQADEVPAASNDRTAHAVPLSHLMLHRLTPRQVQMIDDALREVGEFGEVRLIVQRGRLRFIEKTQSLDALKGI